MAILKFEIINLECPVIRIDYREIYQINLEIVKYRKHKFNYKIHEVLNFS